MTNNQLCKNYCSIIIGDAKEILALLNYNDDRMIELNKSRLTEDIIGIKYYINALESVLQKGDLT